MSPINTYDVQVVTRGASQNIIVIRYVEDPGNLAYVRDVVGALLEHLGKTVSITVRGNRFDSCPELIHLD